MKNQMILVMAITAIFFASSCTNSKAPQAGPGLNVEYSVDTIVTQDVPVLVNRDGCNGDTIPTKIKDGKRIGQKVNGWKKKTDSISMSGVVNISDKKLNEAGYQFSGKSVAPISDVPTDPDKVKSYNNGFMNAWVGFWNFFGPVLGFILALLIAALILYLLYRFFRWLFNQFGSGKERDEHQTQHITSTIIKEPREDRIFLIGGLGLTTETLFRGQVQNHNGVQNIFNVSGDSNNITINTNYPIEPKQEPKQP